MAHGYEVGVVGRRLALHLRLPWLVPYGLSITLGGTSASGVTYSRMRHALIFAGELDDAWMMVG